MKNLFKNGVYNKLFNNRPWESLVADFYIELADPHRLWKPGDTIEGSATLNLKRNVSNIRLVLTLNGLITLRSQPMSTGNVKRHVEKFLQSSAIIYGDEDIASKEVVNGLTKGVHKFPFRIKLPPKLHTSVSFEKGWIGYMMRVSLEAAHEEIAACEKNISVVVPFDVSSMAPATPKIAQFPLADAERSVMLTVDLKHKGFLRGDYIPVHVSLANYKQYTNMSGIIITLTRICRVDDGRQSSEVETFRKDLCQTIIPVHIDESGCTEVVGSLRVPLDVFPSINTKLIKFQYFVEVLVNFSGRVLANTKNEVTTLTLDDTSQPKGSKLDASYIFGNPTHLGKKPQFQDFVNVDRLKRTKNFMGMSIEVVVGTERNAADLQTNMSRSTNEVFVDMPLEPPAIDEGESMPPQTPSKEEIANYESMLYPSEPDPVPMYTPTVGTPTIETPTVRTTMVEPTDNKEELERRRLAALESEPPM